MKKTLVLLLVLAVMLTGLYGKAEAITNLSVTPSPNTAGATAAYTITFTMANALPVGGTINVTFYNGFTVPASIAPATVSVNGYPATTVSVSGQVVTITPSQSAGLPAGYTYIYIQNTAGIKNPSTGGNYPVTVGTSVGSEAPLSVSVPIANAISNVSVSVNPLNAGSTADYYIQFTPGITVPQNYYVYVEFPTGSTIPSSIQSNLITVNGVHCSYVTKTGTKIQIRTPVQLTAGYNCAVSIPSAVGIANPPTAGIYTIKVSTQKETTPVNSNPYTLVGSNITSLYVSVSPNSAATAANYTIQFRTGPSGALTTTSDWIKIKFPSGTVVPNNTSAGYITINGRSCTNRYVSGTTLTAYIPSTLNIPINSWVYVSIADSFGIVNPTTIGNYYTLKVSTSKDTIPATSNTYSITGTSISNFTVSADPTTQNSTAAYTFNFRTSSTGALSRNSSDKIYIQFPTKFTVPSSISGSYVTVNGTPCTTSISVSSDKLTITTPVNIGNSSSNIPIVISQNANIKNPSSSDTYTFSISTTKDVVPASAHLQIVKSTITKPIVQLTGYSVNEIIGVTVTFQTGSGGSLTRNSDKISIVFPAGFVLPSSISKQYVKVNNYNAKSVTKSRQRIDITPSIGIPPNTNVVVVIDKAANIKNPGSQNDYKLSVYTSKETTQIYSDIFKIVILPTTTAIVSPSAPNGNNEYYITAPKVTLSAVSPIDPNPIIYYYFDLGSPIVYSNTITVPDGVHALYYYAVDHQGNTEQAQSKQFKVDTKLPQVTILSPKNNSVLNTKKFTLTGQTESSATVTINNEAVSVDANGGFNYSGTISGETTFTIIAEDIAGNKTTVKLHLSLDTTPPKLQVTEPYAFQEIHTQTVIVKGVTEENATVKINNQPVQLTAEYTFSYALMLTNEGLNSINVTATDLAGNVTKVSIPVNFIPKTKIMLQIANSVAVINEKTIKLDSPPIIVKGRTLVPLRFISEAFGAKVEWNPVFRLVFIKMGEKEIIVQIGTPYASVSGKKVLLDSPPLIVKGRTMVPLRFIAEALGAKVTWDEATKSITIIYPGG